MCREISRNFHGRCVSSRNCASVCHLENSGAGNCRRTKIRSCSSTPAPLNYDVAASNGTDINERKCHWRFGKVCMCMKPCEVGSSPPDEDEPTPAITY